MLRSSVAHLPLSSLASSSRTPLHRTIYAQAPRVLGVLHTRQRHGLAPAPAPIHSLSAPVLHSRRHVVANRTSTPYAAHVRTFHATSRREGWPLIGAMLLSVFKSSGAIEIARMVGRVTLSLSTIVLMGNFKTRKWLKHSPAARAPENQDKRAEVLAKMKKRTILFHALFFTPVAIFWISLLASLERTPLTGRWRPILLAPEEEDDIAASLSNGGWAMAVREIVSQGGPAVIIPSTDWRYRWVESVLRRLEATLPAIHQDYGREDWVEDALPDIPFPPPAEYPLRGRPRASEYLRSICEAMISKHVPSSHGIGAPYSLMLVDDPTSSNAFSYGFGPDGAGGIVVYTGFIDEVLSRAPADGLEAPVAPSAPEPTSWFSTLFGGLAPSNPRHIQPAPTAEQTGELATLLAHELAHLVLAHHLETLSSATIVIPGFLSLVTDFVRVILFPVTMVFGPFVNDALANVGKTSSRDFLRMHENCASAYQEIEADVVSMRLLAYAGFDARDAVRYWEKRVGESSKTECAVNRAEPVARDSASALTRNITGEGHPAADTRILRLREELQRWEEQRQERLEEIRARATSNS